jgi:hypothetical protein
MMKLKEYLDTYYEFSGKTSDVARQLAFAAIAIIWIFRDSDGAHQLLPDKLIVPAFTVMLALALDFAQYVSGTFIWGFFHRFKERGGVEADTEIKASPWLNKPILFFFIAKILSLILGYILILSFLWGRF